MISSTGIGGLTLGGGLGHLMRKLGLTVDNLLSVDLVTAEGVRMRVDDAREPELFWALRGGGGNFGIATSFSYRLHPVGPLVLGGPLFWPLDQAHEVLGFVASIAADAPDELGIAFVATLAPPSPVLPADRYGNPVVGLVVVWSGDIAEGERVIAPLRRLGRPLADAVRPVPYLAVQSMLDGGAPPGRHYYWKSHRLPPFTADVVDVFVERIEAVTSPFSQINGWMMGGAVSRVSGEATAVGDRDIGFDVGITAAWPRSDPDGDRHRAWVRSGWDALRRHSTGVYVNFLSDEGAAGVQAAYGDRLKRLVAVKDQYDPTNVFRMNANISPSGGAR